MEGQGKSYESLKNKKKKGTYKTSIVEDFEISTIFSFYIWNWENRKMIKHLYEHGIGKFVLYIVHCFQKAIRYLIRKRMMMVVIANDQNFIKFSNIMKVLMSGLPCEILYEMKK